jgi:CheY-like chemotaxis protein
MSIANHDQRLELVKDALAHLYDFAYLRTHPLLDMLAPGGPGAMERVLRMRQRLQQGIERLAPEAQIPASAKEWRPYLALRYHYVDCLDLSDVEKRLGLGDRQLLRERNRGLDALVSLLWEDQSPQAPPVDSAQQEDESAVGSEITALGLEYTETSLCELLQSARQAVAGLSARQHVEVECPAPTQDAPVMVDPTLLRQALIAALSHAILTCSAGAVNVQAEQHGRDVQIDVRWQTSESDLWSSPLLTLQALAQAQKGACRTGWAGGVMNVTLTIPQEQAPAVLVIEDNASLRQLYTRYLPSDRFRVLQAESGKDGLETAHREQPDVVVLDVMMRGMDGWEVLQRLKAQPSTRAIPVIICSVLPEEALAHSLGAAVFLAKPVSRVHLLDAIQACLAG